MSNLSDCSNLMVGVSKTSEVGGKGTSGPARSFVRWFFRPSMLFQTSVVVGVLALWPYALQRLPKLDDRAEFKLTFDQIQIQPAPQRPVPANLLQQVRRLTDLPDELSILDEHLTLEVARAFHRHPWIAKVVRVQKQFPASIKVELEYRHPVAMVKCQEGLIPIDLQGTVLPRDDFSPDDVATFPVIQMSNPKSTIRPGSVWDDPTILASAQLAHFLHDKWAPLKLDAIAVSRGDGAKTSYRDLALELMGRGGSRILWGRAPGIDHPGELDPSQKVRRLEKYLVDFGDYVRPNGPYEIDLRHWQEISRHPLTTPPAFTKPGKTPKDEARRPNAEPRKKTRS